MGVLFNTIDLKVASPLGEKDYAPSTKSTEHSGLWVHLPTLTHSGWRNVVKLH